MNKPFTNFLVGIILLGLIPVATVAQQSAKLRFNSNHKFKIVQFTDVHNIYGNENAAHAIENINEVLDAENPDLVIITGDLIFGKPAEESFRAVLDPMEKRGILFAVTFGNHDDENGLSREELLKIAQSYKYNCTSTVEGIYGVTNYALELKENASEKVAEVIYCFDSNSYSKVEGVKGYDWIRMNQIIWYQSQSKKYTAANGGKPVHSLAFMHIPVPEYGVAAADLNSHITGTRMESGGFPKLNSGLFTAMLEMGDVKGMFAGHDHDNDYVVMYYGIALAYGRYTGGNTVYNNLKPNGARVIELTEGSNSFRSYIYLRGGERIQDLIIPDFFIDK